MYRCATVAVPEAAAVNGNASDWPGAEESVVACTARWPTRIGMAGAGDGGAGIDVGVLEGTGVGLGVLAGIGVLVGVLAGTGVLVGVLGGTAVLVGVVVTAPGAEAAPGSSGLMIW